MSLLTLLGNAADRIGIARPSSVVSSTDQQVLRLLGYAQEEGKALARTHAWKVLTQEASFAGTATSVQTSAGSTVIPADFDRFLDETFYNRTRKRPVYGPISAQDWQFSQGVVSTVLVEAFRLRGSSMLMTPSPTSGDDYRFEYISSKWVQQVAGTATAVWTADADVGILSEELMTLGVVWRFKAGQGLDYSEEFRNYQLQVAQAVTQDGGKRTLNSGDRHGRSRRGVFVQDGSWNL